MQALSNNLIKVAKIVAPHGIKGEVKLFISPDFIDIFKDNNFQFYIENSDCKTIPVKIKIRSMNNKSIIAKIDNVSSRNESDLLKGKFVLAIKEDLKEMSEEEFLYSELIGLDVIFKDQIYGKIINILNFGAGDLVEIEKTNREKELLPFKKEIFIEIFSDKVIINLPNYT